MSVTGPTKTSALAELAALAGGDYFPVVDISESAVADKNKRITAQKMFANTVPVTTVAAATYTTTGVESILHVTYTATGAVTITIASADIIDGRRIIIKDAGGNAGTNNITITPASGTIDGAASATISTNYGKAKLYSDGSNLFTI